MLQSGRPRLYGETERGRAEPRGEDRRGEVAHRFKKKGKSRALDVESTTILLNIQLRLSRNLYSSIK